MKSFVPSNCISEAGIPVSSECFLQVSQNQFGARRVVFEPGIVLTMMALAWMFGKILRGEGGSFGHGNLARGGGDWGEGEVGGGRRGVSPLRGLAMFGRG